MEKDTRLINIYLKIHHKKTLTVRDLRYLAQYDPECFEKTCKNVVYNIPEAKPIMIPDIPELSQPPELIQKDEAKPEPELPEWQSIEKVLENLKHLEMQDFPVIDIDADKVKSLLGNLYMELLFPHNDNYPFMDLTDMMDKINAPSFDKRA
ncbi:MAG: hypothetical protein HDQ96_07770 [Lachnospiraceae bacterium]|nr:hypothetical protein [Lachnospiraceae bacterium]